MFTRKHYKAIAAIIERCSGLDIHHGYQTTHMADLVGELANFFLADNRNFDKEKFLNACGVPADIDLLPEYNCEQCGKALGAEFILGPVCGKCCRKNHRQVANPTA